MIQDSLTLLAGSLVGGNVTGQSLIGAAGTYNSTNTIDTGGVGTQGGNPGLFDASGDLAVVINVVQGFSAGATVTFNLVQADDAGLTTNVEVLSSSGPLPTSSLPAGAQTTLSMRNAAPSGLKRRYFGLQSVTSSTLSAGSIIAALSPAVPDAVGNLGNTLYKSNFVVL